MRGELTLETVSTRMYILVWHDLMCLYCPFVFTAHIKDIIKLKGETF